ncbi:hypothetical protein Csa_014102 [Cucumis sativus]|nr:hypothetical protein Csa_014102 [Cucumis sativus]
MQLPEMKTLISVLLGPEGSLELKLLHWLLSKMGLCGKVTKDFSWTRSSSCHSATVEMLQINSEYY